MAVSPSAVLVKKQQQQQPSLPSAELLCPFEDKETRERHLMENAIVVPCCGYFICCENCKFQIFFYFFARIRYSGSGTWCWKSDDQSTGFLAIFLRLFELFFPKKNLSFHLMIKFFGKNYRE
jgi:hypothetical protein